MPYQVNPDHGYLDWRSTAGSIGAMTDVQGDDGTTVPPDGSGIVYLAGTIVANATNPKPLYLTGDAGTSTETFELQLGAAITGAPLDSNDAGIASFNDTQFTVSANGYVSLVGGTDLPSVQTLTGDDAVAVGPDANGNIDLTGLVVANATNAKPVYVNGGTNAEVIEVQVAAAITGSPANSNDAGICSFDDTDFTVDANGYVSLLGTGAGETITGDTGGALSPTGGNWNILGGPGVTTTGSGSTLTINSVVYTDQTATTLVVDSGTWATAAGAYVLPAAPTNGELCEIVCITTGIIVTANTGQTIQIGGDVTSTAGTATNSAKGDSLWLRYRDTDAAWYSLATTGVWVLA